jgi:ABC-type uncharacterized transport system ATPase subunit
MMVDKKTMNSSAEGLISKFGIKVSDSGAMASSLSGGNIQKLVVARELTQKSQVVVAEQPTAGLDVKASQSVHERLLELRRKGAGILLVSSDLDEIIKLSDRILVIFSGKFIGEFTYRDLDIHKLAKLMLGSEE